jgi:hypothetical protein
MNNPKVKIDYRWLRGFADRASQIHRASRAIFLTSSDHDLLREVFSFLVIEKFKCHWTDMGARYGIRISGKESLMAWRKKVGFSNSDKMQQLSLLIGDKK